MIFVAIFLVHHGLNFNELVFILLESLRRTVDLFDDSWGVFRLKRKIHSGLFHASASAKTRYALFPGMWQGPLACRMESSVRKFRIRKSGRLTGG